MVQLYDAKGQPLPDMPAEEAQKLYLSGKAGFKKDSYVGVVDSEGKVVATPADDLKNTLESGYSLATDDQKNIYNYLRDNQGISGSIKSGTAALANQALFGVPQAAMSKQELDQLNALQAEHPIATLGGGLAGTAAALAVPGIGELGKGAEALALGGKAASEVGFGAKVLGSAAKYGTEAAAFAAPEAATQALMGRPEEAGEHLLYGLGTGLALGAAAPLIKGVGKFGLGVLGKPIGLDLSAANPLEKMGTEQTLRSLQASESTNDTKLINTLADKIAGGKTAEGRKVIADFIHDENLTKGIGKDFASNLEQVTQHKNAVGEEIGSLYKELDNHGAVGPTTDDLVEKLTREVVDPLKKSPTKAAERRAIDSYLDELRSSSQEINKERGWSPIDANGNEVPEPPMTLNNLNKMRQELDAKIYAEKRASLGNPSPLHEEFSKVRNIIDQEIKIRGEQVMQGEGKKFIEPLNTLNRKYQILSTLSEVLDNSVIKEQKNRNFSLSDYQLGGASGVGAAAALHNPLALVAGIGGAVGNKFLRENGNIIMAKIARMADQQFDKIPTILKNMASNTPSKLTALASAKSYNIWEALTGDKTNNDQEGFDNASHKLSAIASDPQSPAVQQVADNLPPEIANNYINANKKAIGYLYDQLPKNPNPNSPFAEKWQPTKSQMKEFKDQADIVINPWNAIEYLQTGKLNNNHVKALKNAYPTIQQKLNETIKQYGMEHPKMPYNKRLHLSLLLGEPLDNSLRKIASYQSSYNSQQQQSKPIAKGKLDDLPGTQPTQNQIVSEGRNQTA